MFPPKVTKYGLNITIFSLTVGIERVKMLDE